tara:strand:- start:4294 stop:5679 length:1386 start_codon:yes stop_codon:yes gene_type:complete
MGLNNLGITKLKAATLQQVTKAASGSKNSAVLVGQSIVLLEPDQIIVQKQVRDKLDDKTVVELAESIKNYDQQQPIIVRLDTESGQRDRFILEKGERRLAACRLLGIKVAAVVSAAKHDELKAHAGQLIENIQREDLTPFEIAHALHRFVIDADMSHRRIARAIGKNDKYVTLYLSLVKATKEVERLHDDGIVADAETLNILRKLIEIDPASEAHFIDVIRRQDGITRIQARRWLSWAKEASEQGVTPSEFITAKEEQITTSPQAQVESQAEAETSESSTMETASQSTERERPGRDVGEGSLLDMHKGPLAGDEDEDAYEDEEPLHTLVTETTTTKLSETTTAGGSTTQATSENTLDAEKPSETKTTKEEQQAEMFGEDPASMVSSSPDNASTDTVECEGYVQYPIGRLDVQVEVNGNVGVLMLDRLDDDSTIVWVMFDGVPQQVNVEDAQLYCMQPTGSN